jgi:predicted transglutaminase-like cysteine proteinase
MSIRRKLSKVAGAAAILFAANAAHAQAPAFMPRGAAVAPPPGFVDLCQRDQTACGVMVADAMAFAAPAVAIMPTSSIGDTRAASFAQSPAPAASAVEDAEPFPMLRFEILTAYRPAIATDFTAAGERFSTLAASDQVAAEPAAPMLALAQPLEGKRFLKLINTVNQDVNREVKKSTDFDLYGLMEYWTLPRVINGKMYGDCEDYALEKRRRLIAAGVPTEALSMAVAITARGESHAVLVVSLESGDWVLDNLTPWATPWGEMNYHWVQRQIAGTSRWVAIT